MRPIRRAFSAYSDNVLFGSKLRSPGFRSMREGVLKQMNAFGYGFVVLMFAYRE